MDPTTSFVLAVVAIVVSLLSVVASFAALRQFPRPFFVARVRKNDKRSQNVETVEILFTNMGKASAHDVRLGMTNLGSGAFERLWTVDEFKTSRLEEKRLSLVSGSSIPVPYVDPRFGHESFTWPHGDVKDMDLDFELRWRQAPTMNRIRTKTFRMTVEDSTVRFAQKFSFSRWIASIWHWLRFPLDIVRGSRHRSQHD